MDKISSREALLQDAVDRAPTDPVSIDIRSLVGLWGGKARGAVILRRIRQDLRARGLGTEPDFTTGWIDSQVRLVLIERTAPEPPPVMEVSLKVGALKAANQTVLSVKPDDPVQRAQTLMMLHDYSQLLVQSSARSVLGAISWESIGRRRIAGEPETSREAVTPVRMVDLDDDLLPLLPVIADAGFVVILARNKTVSGIVTTADVSLGFNALASPFFILGELERRLRLLITERFEAEELQELRHPRDADRQIETADDLSLGEIVRLLESRDSWERLTWKVDRAEFVNSLHEVREVRNRLMHFSPDLPTDEEVAQMRHILSFLRMLT